MNDISSLVRKYQNDQINIMLTRLYDSGEYQAIREFLELSKPSDEEEE